MNNRTNQNDSFDYEAYRAYTEKKQEKRRIKSALASCCILILGSYLSVSLFYFFMQGIITYLCGRFTILESDYAVLDTFTGVAAYCTQLVIPAAVFMLLRGKKYRDCIFVLDVEDYGKMKISEIIC